VLCGRCRAGDRPGCIRGREVVGKWVCGHGAQTLVRHMGMRYRGTCRSRQVPSGTVRKHQSRAPTRFTTDTTLGLAGGCVVCGV
jgi:hypothetical protein